MSVTICLMRGFLILPVLTRCEMPAWAKADNTAESVLTVVSTTAIPFSMSDE